MGLLAVAWFGGEPLLVEYRRWKVRRQPFPEAWREILRRRVPYFRSLPADLQLQLKKRMQVFLAEKPFIGCDGLEVTDEMRVTIAAQACLLILNRRTDYFANLRRILVYPGAFLVDRVHTDGAGVLQERRQVLSGESWSQGQVIVSWDDVVEGASVVDDGRNVVIHEFAHQLDQQNGHANGAPILGGRRRRERWARVLGEEFARLQEAANRGEAVAPQSLRCDEPGGVLCGGERGVLRAAGKDGRGASGVVFRALAFLSRESAELVGRSRIPFSAVTPVPGGPGHGVKCAPRRGG